MIGMIKKRDCGNCKHFQKVPGYGICMRYDYWTQSDHGRNCLGWSGIKYDRVENKKEERGELWNQNINLE